MKKICVIGSLNMDLVAEVQFFPKPGETLIGKGFFTYPGGKGANQAVAVGRLISQVQMIGKVGSDIYGKKLLQNMKQNGVKLNGIGIEKDTSSGIALIEVDNTGEKNIIVLPGANYRIDLEYIDSQLQYMQEFDIFLLQLEIPLDAIFYTIKKLKERQKIIILDPDPIQLLPEDLYQYIDFITPNEMELSELSGKEKIETEDDIYQAAHCLLHKGVQTVIVKAGENGAYIINSNESAHIPGFQVKAVDTVAAGDAFNAGFAVSLAQGQDLRNCVRFANAAGALSTISKGAQRALPTLEQVQLFINYQNQIK
jgi:ribokinase